MAHRAGLDRCPASWGFSCIVCAPQQSESDWSVGQIEHQVAHQIELGARLDPEGRQIACCTRLPDWALFQIGLRARFSDWSLRQIGAFLPQAVRRTLCLSRAPDWVQCQIAAEMSFLPLRAFSRLIRLSLFSGCQIGSDWAPRQIGARLTSTTQTGCMKLQTST